jgi:hypothetical protein
MKYICERCEDSCELSDKSGMPPILCPYFAYLVPEWEEKEKEVD